MTHWILHSNALQMHEPLSASVHGSYRNGRRLHGAYYEGKRVAETRGNAYERGAKTYKAADLEHFVAGYHQDPIDVSHSDGLAIMPSNHADRLADLLANWPEQRDLFDTPRRPLVLQVGHPVYTDPLIIAKYDRFEVWVAERSGV